MSPGLRRVLDAALYSAAALVLLLAFTPSRAAWLTRRPRPVEEWTRLVNSGTVSGNPAARVVIVEFVDYDCPYCRHMHTVLMRLRQQFPQHVTVSYKHFPIASPEFAREAAAAALCADKQGRFDAYHEFLFEAPIKSRRGRSWTVIARDVGVADTAAFEQCRHDAAISERIRTDVTDGRKLRISGTPTFFVNGFQLGSDSADRHLPNLVRQLIRQSNAR